MRGFCGGFGGGEVSIGLEQVSVRYRVPSERIGTFKEYIIRRLRGQVDHHEFSALRDVSLAIAPDNRLLVADGEVRIRFGQKQTRLSRQQTKTLLDGWLPVVLLTAVNVVGVREGWRVQHMAHQGLQTQRLAHHLLRWGPDSDDPVLFVEHATLYQARGEVPAGVGMGGDVRREGDSR